jgi:hypothetical protein
VLCAPSGPTTSCPWSARGRRPLGRVHDHRGPVAHPVPEPSNARMIGRPLAGFSHSKGPARLTRVRGFVCNTPVQGMQWTSRSVRNASRRAEKLRAEQEEYFRLMAAATATRKRHDWSARTSGLVVSSATAGPALALASPPARSERADVPISGPATCANASASISLIDCGRRSRSGSSPQHRRRLPRATSRATARSAMGRRRRQSSCQAESVPARGVPR